MKVSLSLETSEGVVDKTKAIHDLSAELTDHFSEKDYGDDVKEIIIGLIVVAPEFEWFSKVRKPRYTFYRKYSKEGMEFVLDRLFCYDLKIDYESFKHQPDDQNKKMLAAEILESLSNLDRLPKKVKDFDKLRFRKDMDAFFNQLLHHF